MTGRRSGGRAATAIASSATSTAPRTATRALDTGRIVAAGSALLKTSPLRVDRRPGRHAASSLRRTAPALPDLPRRLPGGRPLRPGHMVGAGTQLAACAGRRKAHLVRRKGPRSEARMHVTTRAARAGFTLVEVLLASAMGALLLA